MCNLTRKNVKGTIVIFNMSLRKMTVSKVSVNTQTCIQGQPGTFFQSIFLVLRTGSCWWV